MKAKSLKFLCLILVVLLAIAVVYAKKATEDAQKLADRAYKRGVNAGYAQAQIPTEKAASKAYELPPRATSIPAQTIPSFTIPSTKEPFIGAAELFLSTYAPTAQQYIRTPAPSAQRFILNKSTHVFHYPNCSSVDQMKEKNKLEYYGTAAGARNKGYRPCGRCNPR